MIGIFSLPKYSDKATRENILSSSVAENSNFFHKGSTFVLLSNFLKQDFPNESKRH